MEMTANNSTKDFIVFDGYFRCKEWDTVNMFDEVTFFNCTLLKDIYPFKMGDTIDTIRWNFGNHTLTLVEGVCSCVHNDTFNIE